LEHKKEIQFWVVSFDPFILFWNFCCLLTDKILLSTQLSNVGIVRTILTWIRVKSSLYVRFEDLSFLKKPES
jgi:hypothetical protein